jgi:hypothetical protein
MKNKSFFLLALLVGCSGVRWRPAQIHSEDPNRAQQQRIEETTAQANAEAFIAEHPELDEQTKKDLRDGTINPVEAQERMKKNPPVPPKK